MSSYAYDNIEVILTGRVARRELASRAGRPPKVDELVEIKPKSDEDGSWNKFVRMKELYEIEE